jgi:hypothetical protein
MNAVLKFFYAPIQLLSHPEHDYVVAALFAILFVASLVRSGTFQPRRHLVMLFAVVAWLLFGLNEVQAQANGWNIRADLLFSWPIVLAVSIAAAWNGFRKLKPEPRP